VSCGLCSRNRPSCGTAGWLVTALCAAYRDRGAFRSPRGTDPGRRSSRAGPDGPGPHHHACTHEDAKVSASGHGLEWDAEGGPDQPGPCRADGCPTHAGFGVGGRACVMAASDPVLAPACRCRRCDARRIRRRCLLTQSVTGLCILCPARCGPRPRLRSRSREWGHWPCMLCCQSMHAEMDAVQISSSISHSLDVQDSPCRARGERAVELRDRPRDRPSRPSRRAVPTRQERRHDAAGAPS
jgi:hypothetical protein